MRRLLRSGLTVLTTLSILATPIHTNPVDASHPDQQTHLQQPLEEPQHLSEPNQHQHQVPNDLPTPKSHRIAIIGAGPAGSSTAHHLRQFASTTLTTPNITLTIFDQNPYIGGRTTTVNALNDARYPVELGASIFVDINAILYNATRDFELPVDEREFQGSGVDEAPKYELGVWDGEEFVFMVAADSGSGWRGRLAGWWDVAKLLWRYGVSPVRFRGVQRGTIGKFLRMYQDGEGGSFPFEDLTTVAGELDLLSVTGKSGSALLADAGISEMFAREIVQASSRVNYAQNLDEFQGLETMVCMSTEGAMSVEGGNWRIFDRMVKGSGATVRLNTTVTGVVTTKNGVSYVTYRKTKTGRTDDIDNENEANRLTVEEFDTVILAHPHNPSKLHIAPPPPIPRETPDYVTLHVTLLTTPSRPDPSFFNLPPNTPPALLPSTILTTLPSTLDPSFLGRGIAGLGLTPFWSLSTLRTLDPSTDSIPSHLTSGHIPLESLSLNQTQYLYKIFSPEPVDAEFLADLFGWTWDGDGDVHGSNLGSLPRELLSWYHVKEWQSYPYLVPREDFESWDVYKGAEGEAEGMKETVWSTAPMEVFISTMETMALSGRNVARLVVDLLERNGKGR